MKILIFANEDDFVTHSIDTIEAGISRQVPGFSFSRTACPEQFTSALGCFKIIAHSNRDQWQNIPADLVWPDPVEILKNNNIKSKVWEDVQNLVIPKFREELESDFNLEITETELQRLLKALINASAPFFIYLKDGTKVNVNQKQDDGVNITSSDIASMLAASWIFRSKQIRIPKEVVNAESPSSC